MSARQFGLVGDVSVQRDYDGDGALTVNNWVFSTDSPIAAYDVH